MRELTVNKEKLVRLGRWMAVLPAYFITPFILYFFFDLFWQFRAPTARYYGIPMDEPPSLIGVLWIDIVVRTASFWVAVQIAPSHKKAVFVVLLVCWILFSVIYCGFEIAGGGPWFVVFPFILQLAALLGLMRILSFEKEIGGGVTRPER